MLQALSLCIADESGQGNLRQVYTYLSSPCYLADSTFASDFSG